jgi:hypothetical protein
MLQRARRSQRGGRTALVAAMLFAVAVPTSGARGASAIGPASATNADAAALIARVASTYAYATRGVLGARSISSLTIAAPVFRKTIRDDTWFVFADGNLVQSGKPPDPRQPPLHDPYRAEYLGEYRYAVAACAACTKDDVDIAFESPSHDVAHARGDLIVDRATGRIISSRETPYKLPWPTKDGYLDATWGSVAGRWLPVAISGTFEGRIGPFIGHASYSQTLTFADYRTLDDAAKALGAPEPANR